MSIDRIGAGTPNGIESTHDEEGSAGSVLLMSSEGLLAIELGGDTNAAVAAMLLKHSQEKRELLRGARRAEEHHVQSMEEQQVAAMRAQAEHVRAAGRARAYGAMVSGAMSIGAGACMLSIDSEAAAGGTSHLLDGFGKASEGAGGLLGAEHDHASGQAEADATSAGNKAAEAERRLDDLKDEENAATELLRTAIDFLKDMSRASAEAQQGAIFKRV